MTESLLTMSVNDMLPSQRARFIDQLFMSGKRDRVETEYGISMRSALRYRRMLHLIPEFSSMLDTNRLPFLSAYDLSFLDSCEQCMVYETLTPFKIQLKPAYAREIRKLAGRLNPKMIEDIILSEEMKNTRREGTSIMLPLDICNLFFRAMSQSEIISKVQRVMKEWNKSHEVEERLMLMNRLLYAYI